MALRYLIDIHAFQSLLDSFSRLTGIPTAILDLQGEVLIATGWRKICTEFHRKHEVTTSRCLKSDTVLAGKLAQGERYNIYKCENGLVDVAVPINIENAHVGNLFIGQFLFEPPDVTFFARQAEKFGFDKDLYLEALSGVSILSVERIKQAIDFLTNLTTVIGNAGLDKKNLFELNRYLELRIQERTAELNYSNERLRVLTEASFEGIIISENGVIIEANNAASAMLGFQQATDLIGIKVMDCVAPEKRKDAREKVLSGYEKSYETLGLNRNGETFPIEARGRTFSYQGRQVRGTAIRDLTGQKKAEKEIQTLRGILPICSFCKKIRDDGGYWEQVDIYIRNHSEADFSHGICPDCMKKHFPKYSSPDVDEE